jgi:hypothetical protein
MQQGNVAKGTLEQLVGVCISVEECAGKKAAHTLPPLSLCT